MRVIECQAIRAQPICSLVSDRMNTRAPIIAENIPVAFLLRSSIRLFHTRWFGLLWERYHHDLEKLENRFLRFYGKRELDIKSYLKNPNDSRELIRTHNTFSSAVESLFLTDDGWMRYDDKAWIYQADEFEIEKLKKELMKNLEPSLLDENLSVSELCSESDVNSNKSGFLLLQKNPENLMFA